MARRDPGKQPQRDNIDGTDSGETLNGTQAQDFINGFGGDDILNGLGGDDFLIGGTGDDTMTGGLGNDTFYIDAATDIVNETSGEGNDRVAASVSYALGADTDIQIIEAVNLGDNVAM